MEDLVIRIANILELLAIDGLNLKCRKQFKNYLLLLEKQNINCTIVSFIEREAQLMKTFFV